MNWSPEVIHQHFKQEIESLMDGQAYFIGGITIWRDGDLYYIGGLKQVTLDEAVEAAIQQWERL